MVGCPTVPCQHCRAAVLESGDQPPARPIDVLRRMRITWVRDAMPTRKDGDRFGNVLWCTSVSTFEIGPWDWPKGVGWIPLTEDRTP